MSEYYWSPSEASFFPSALYGTRTVPTPSEEDPDALVEVPNPHCTLPDDAVPIPTSVYEEALIARERGHHIIAGDDGLPQQVAPPSESLTALKVRRMNDIDKAAGAARAAFVSPGSYIDQEYLLAKQEASDWLADGQDEAAIPSSVQDHITMFEVNAETAAREIVATAEQWETALREIRNIRLGGKASVQRAESIEAAEEGANQAIQQLNRYRPAI